jgi:FMN phosphatase YigB (HAD superfamily)
MIYEKDNKPIFEKYDLILVDLYNTLVRNIVRVHPYKVIFKEFENKIDIPSRTLFDKCMKSNLFIQDFLMKEFNIKMSSDSINEFNSLLKEEFDSVMFHKELITSLTVANTKIVLISNLSPEYYEPIPELKTIMKLDNEVLSFKEGILKPDISIFNKAISLYPSAKNILMIGDNYKLDIEPTITLDIDSYLVPKWW